MKLAVDVQIRDKTGKGVARQLRREGRIPAVLYGSGQSVLLSMDPRVARHVVLSQAGHTGLLTVLITGEPQQEDRVAVLQDYQVDPITGVLLHVDLFEVSMNKPLRVKVPITVVGDAPIGLKEGGILHQPLRDLSVECLPSQLPDHIGVDASTLHVGQGMLVKDIMVPEGVRVLEEEAVKVVHVAAKMSEAKLEALLTRETQEGAGEAVAPAADKGKVEESGSSGGADSKSKEGKK